MACNYSNPANMEEQEKAVKAAMGADGVVLIMGLDQSQEREGLDRKSLSLPGRQQDLILKVVGSACGSSNPAGSCPNIVLVIMSGSPLDVGFAKNLPHISSIIWVGYPGEAGGQALAEIIYGDYNPGMSHHNVYAKMHTYIHAHIICIHAYMTYIHACSHTYIHTYIHTCMLTYIHTYMHAYIYTFMHAHIHAYCLICVLL